MVRTAEGREISFRLELTMHREHEHLDALRLRMGEAAASDPLVVNLDGTSVRLSAVRFDFGLDGDGEAEKVPLLERGSGFLVLDLDGDGKVSGGKEMFGPLSGDGFAELAAHDADGNGWIDEADPVFRELRIWVKNREEDRLLSLVEAGIGAITLGRASTPFSIGRSVSERLGTVRSTGIYLREDGAAGFIQQLDFSV